MRERIPRKLIWKWLRKFPTPFIKMVTFILLPVYVVAPLFTEWAAWEQLKEWWSDLTCVIVEDEK